MKSKLLLLALACSIGTAYAGDGKDGNDEVLRKSGARSATNVSYPVPFNPAGATARTQPAISTGYYLVDNDDDAGPYWYPDVSKFVLETTNPVLWHDIVTGPGQLPDEFWDGNPEGRAFFRNPGRLIDSTNNAFAGPIPIGLNGGFKFNGVRYDSFYVSTNGLIALSNRRYFYNPVDGQRYIPPGSTTGAYDPNSDDTRPRSGDGLSDGTFDDFGYLYIANGGTPTDSTRGIRYPNSGLGDNNISFENNNPTNPPQLPSKMNEHTPMIAPFWDDLQLSVYNPYENRTDNFGQVRYYRNPDENILVIYFKNLTPIGTKANPPNVGGQTIFKKDIRPDNPTNDPFVSVSAQVHLNGADNSITYIYEDFIGAVPVGFTSVSSRDYFRVNSTIGVRGYARHINFPPGGAEVKYLQTTEYLANNAVRTVNRPGAADTDNSTPRPQLAIKFKQWKNVLRVVNIVYNIPKRAASSPMPNFDSTITNVNNFELLAGDQRLGAIQPVGLFQNLTNNIQGPSGVNYQEQDLKFRVRFKILNQATGRVIYNRLVDVNELAIANPTVSGVKLTDITGTPNLYNSATMTGVPPYSYVQVKFPAFETNEFIDNQIGRLQAVIIADPTTPTNESLRDEWPFDDTTAVELFNIRRMTSFSDDVREYHLIGQTPMPSVMKWVNINGDVLDGESATYNPPPPRGEYAADNNPQFKTQSPVIRLNRTTLQEAEPANPYTGDEIISFPIDLRGRKGAVLSVSYQRTGRALEDWKRGWSDATLFGPEVRTILDGVETNVVGNGGDQPTSGFPDRLLVEFARPSLDGVNGITNIPTANYRYAPRPVGNPITDNAAYTIYGGGGYRTGYDPLDYNTPLTFAEGLVSKIDDDGKDQEFYKLFITIPDTIINAENEGAKNFRFRLRVLASKNSSPPQPQDDNDNFFVDNIRILFPSEVPDIELSSITANWPYTAAPASQATQIPIRAKIANNTGITSQAFSVNARILRNNSPQDDVYGVYGVGRSLTVPFLPGNREIELPMPNWNARNGGPQKDTVRNEFVDAEYTLLGHIANNEGGGGDLEPLNDTTYSKMKLVFGPVFAYDPVSTPTNNVPEQQFSNTPGKGLNLPGQNSGGYTFASAFGPPGGLQSGQMAMKFTLYAQDTVQGYQAFFAPINQDPDQFITFALYRDQGGSPSAQPVIGSHITRLRGVGEDNVFTVDKYTTYKLDKPVVLPPGDYWAAVGQTFVGIELGGSASRMGMVTTVRGTIPVLGVGGTSLMIDKAFRRKQGSRLINDNRFAYENTKGTGTWSQFMPFVGNPGYAHLDHYGTSSGFQTNSRGTWIPMVRPFLGKRAFNQNVLPVELSPLAGAARNGGADLWWSTASEVNNSGFSVERREVGQADWTEAGFVKGKGNSSKKEDYNYFDGAVLAGNTYEYRLRQIDLDGTESFSNSVEIEIGIGNEVAIAPAYPNPFSMGESMTVKYALPTETLVKVEIVDVFGKVVRSLVNEQQSGAKEVKWDGRNDAGVTVASGSYIYRIVAGEATQTGTITFVQ